MSGWQDIASAPRDGSWFVTANFSINGTREYEIGRYHPVYWTRYKVAEHGLYRKVEEPVSEFTHDNFHRATHWTALPDAPEPSK